MFRSPGSMDERAGGPQSGCPASVWVSTGAFEKGKFTPGLRVSVETIVPLDTGGTLKTDIGKGGRANLKIERRKMARSPYQNGCLFIRGKRRKLWVARWREDVILADGSTGRVMRSAVLGPVSQIAGQRE